MKRLLFFLAFCVAVLFSFSQNCISNRYSDTIFHKVTVTSDIKYGNAFAYAALIPQDLTLDIYEPTGDTLKNRPLIVYAFGGAFLIGFKTQPPIPSYCEYLAKCGYVVVSINYRIGFNTLSGASTERAVYRAAQDLRAAVRFIAQRATQYRVDTAAIFLTGSSAGCFSGLHSTFMDQNQAPISYQGITLEPDNLGCFDCSTNSDNNQHMPKPRGIMNHWGAILDTSFITSATKHNVPVISFHGDQDSLVPYIGGHPFGYPIFPVVYGSVPIHRRLTSVGIKNKLVPLIGLGHEPWLLSLNPTAVLDTVLKYTKPFLLEILKPLPLTIIGDSTVCVNEKGNYSVALRNGSTYCWSISGGGNILSQNKNQILVKWTTSGTFTVKVREMTLNDVNGDEYSFVVKVIKRPIANFGYSNTQLAVVYSDSSIDAKSWRYSFGDGDTALIPNPAHNFPKGITYTTRLIVSNGYCADTTFKSFTLDTCPRANFTFSVKGDSVYFVGDASNGVSFQWKFGDGDSSQLLSPTHGYSKSGNYLATFSITSAKGCKVTTSKIVSYEKIVNSVEELHANDIYISPNPAKDFIWLQCKNCNYKLYDLQGKLISESKEVVSSKIDLTRLSEGYCFMELTHEGNKFVTKVLKVK